jgi:hypothetical protein
MERRSEPAAACIPNIGPGQRRNRVRTGLFAALATLLLVLVLLLTGAPRPVRLVLFLPLLVSAYGFFQARAKT